MNGSPIEEKVDHLMNNSLHVTAPAPNVADRLSAIENKVGKLVICLLCNCIVFPGCSRVL